MVEMHALPFTLKVATRAAKNKHLHIMATLLNHDCVYLRCIAYELGAERGWMP